MDLNAPLNEIMNSLNDLPRVGLAVLLVAITVVLSRWQRADLEKDLTIATVRSFFQLIIIGYLLEVIFQQDHPLWTTLILLVMITIAGRTSGQRGKLTPHATLIALASIGVGTALTLVFLLVIGVFDYTPQSIIPIGGMVIGNAMTTASLVMNRMSDDLVDQRNAIETRLALGATSREASEIQFRRSLRNAMIPHIDTTKTVGLIKLPGAMTGMILAGASPMEAVQLQIIVMYLLVGANMFTGLLSAYLTYRQFFTGAHQLKALAQFR